MRHQKFTRQEKKANRSANIASAMAGGGLFVYENSSAHADLKLPRPTKTGLREVGPKQQFQGDDYYLQLVQTGMLRLINVLQTSEEEMAALESEEQKLIVDQPDRVTCEGKVEQHVVRRDSPLKKAEAAENREVLLNEGPHDDTFVIVTD